MGTGSTGSTGTAASSPWTSSRGSGAGLQRPKRGQRRRNLEEEMFGGEKRRSKTQEEEGEQGFQNLSKPTGQQGLKKEVGTLLTMLDGETRLLVRGKLTNVAFPSM